MCHVSLGQGPCSLANYDTSCDYQQDPNNNYYCTCSDPANVWPDPITGYCTLSVCGGGTLFCRNGGSCSGSSCVCPPGYSGNNCQDCKSNQTKLLYTRYN